MFTTVLQGNKNLGDLESKPISRTNLDLKDMALQAPDAIAVTGGTLDGTVIGGLVFFRLLCFREY